MKKITSVLLTVLLMAGVFLGVIQLPGTTVTASAAPVTNWYTSNPGANTFYIATADELAGLAQLVNSGIDFAGRTVILLKDITLSGQWTPIGIRTALYGSSYSFRGTFDGQGSVIRNLTITKTTTENYVTYHGLFGSIDGAVIKNVGVENANIDINNTHADGALMVGGICGRSSLSSFRNCYVTGTIRASANVGVDVGGIIGCYSSTTSNNYIDKCYNESAVSAYDAGSGNGVFNAGGICGWFSGGRGDLDSFGISLLSDCSNIGSVIAVADQYGVTSVGGVLGYGEGIIHVISCYNVGALSSSASHIQSAKVGGVIGHCCGDSLDESRVSIGGLYWNTDSEQRLNGNILSKVNKAGIGGSCSQSGTVGLTTANMQGQANQSNYSGFDFTNTWTFSSGINNNYPILRFALPKSVTVGAQIGTLTAGTAGSVAFNVTTENIASRLYAVSLNPKPTGVTCDDIVISNGMGTLVINITAAVAAGTYPMTVTIYGATSLSFDLVVDAPPQKTVSVGAQNGTLTTGTAGSATYTVTTASIADSTYPVTLNGAPAGVSADGLTISSNAGTLTINTTAAVAAGTYPLTATINGATSGSFDLTVSPVPVIPVITISTQPTSSTVTYGNISGDLTVAASVTLGGTPEFEWFSNATNSNSGGTSTGVTTASFAIPQNLSAGTYYYYCVVSATGAAPVTSNVATVTVAKADQAALSITGLDATYTYGQPPILVSTSGGSGTGTVSYASNNTGVATVTDDTITIVGAGTATITATKAADDNYNQATATFNITVNAINAVAPDITSQPQGAAYTRGDPATALSVAADATDGGTLSYQWYSNTVNSTSGGTAVGTDSSTYTPGTDTVGTTYYYVVVTNTISDNGDGGTKSAAATSDAVAVVVNAAPTYEISVTPQSKTFPTVRAGYDNALLVQQFTVENTGTGPITNLAASIGVADFEIITGLSKTSLSPGETATVSVRPISGLAANLNAYVDALIIAADNDVEELIVLEFLVSDVPIYSAELDPISKTFTAAQAGYSNADMTQVFTITNTGTEDITGLSVSLDNQHFEISSGLASTTLPAYGELTISVKPVTGLTANASPYTDMLRITGDDSISLSASLSFTVSAAPSYTIAISPTSKVFDAALAGYSNVGMAQTFTIRNTGSGQITNLTASFSNTTNFEITTPLSALTIAPDGTVTIGIAPKSGLAASATPYTVTLTITGSNGVSESVTLSFTVNPVPDNVVYGDLSGTGTVDGADLILMLRCAANPGLIDTIGLAVADVNCDGLFNSADVILLLKYFAQPGIVLGPQP